MKTKEFLSELNLDQLRVAKEEAERLIRAKEDEERVTLYVVEGSIINEAAYPSDQFDLAKKKVCEMIMSDEFTEDDVYSDHPKIVRRRVRESEVADYMNLNT